jgi:tRNA 2-selenouridine synthase
MKEPLAVDAADCFTLAAANHTQERWGYGCVVDARSAGEFEEDHLPGAVNWPVLNNAQRALVGTLHREQGAFAARRTGAALVARNIATLLETHVHALDPRMPVLVYCWRGGQRSGALATVLARIGYRVVVLAGGYKSFRREVIRQLPLLAARLRLRVVAGRTGSGKTALLAQLRSHGQQVLDLEAIACHRGSVLGADPLSPQPSQRAFETRLWSALRQFDAHLPVWVEAESKRIGLCTLPDPLVDAMRGSPCTLLNVAVEVRTSFLLQEYPFWIENAEALHTALLRLQPLLGSETLQALRALLARNAHQDFVRRILQVHYDPLYDRALKHNYPANTLRVLSLERLDAATLSRIAQELGGWDPSRASALGTEPVGEGFHLDLAAQNTHKGVGHRPALE